MLVWSENITYFCSVNYLKQHTMVVNEKVNVICKITIGPSIVFL
jgi:hypothetical protein